MLILEEKTKLWGDVNYIVLLLEMLAHQSKQMQYLVPATFTACNHTVMAWLSIDAVVIVLIFLIVR